MIPVMLLAVTTVLAVSAVAVSLFAVWRSQKLTLASDERARAGVEQCEAALEALRRKLEEVPAVIGEGEYQPSPVPLASHPKCGLNLSTRSQVLRMHRKGDRQDRIASELGLPLQEVDLLIKVHRIVIGALDR